MEGSRLQDGKFVTLTKRKRDRGKENGKELLRNLKNSYLVVSKIELSLKCFITWSVQIHIHSPARRK